MKRILAVLMCVMLIFCASCGKKDEGAPQETQKNLVEEATGDINKKIAEDPMSVEDKDIEKAKEDAEKMEEDLKAQVGKVQEEDAEQFQNRQAAVAILKQGLETLEEAKKAGDQEAVKSAQMQIQMAQSLWDFVQE